MTTQQIHRAMQQAVAHHQSGRIAHAEQTYREVLRHDRRNADALHLLGLLAHQVGRHDEAIELINKAITIRPQAEFFVNLSQAYRGKGQKNQSLDACRRAVQLGPKIPEAWGNLGAALKDLNQPDEALAAFEHALLLRPNYVVALNNMGNVLSQLGRPAHAETAFRRAIDVDPNYAEAYSNLALLIGKPGRLDEAVSLCRQAIRIRPDFVAAYMNLGTALQEQGYLDAGNEVYRHAAQLDPNHARLHENLLGAFTQTTRWSPQEALEASKSWGRRFATPAAPIPPHSNDRSPNRKLRIGYASPDFRRHSVAYFFEPILDAHDRENFEIIAYANLERRDDVTERLRPRFDRWREVAGLTTEQIVRMIREDAIDVLVDLAGHTAGNLLVPMGHKPAPVQMTYLGFPGTTGVPAIDYRLTDEIADPPGVTDAHNSEKLIRLPAPFLCYRPPENSPLPAVDPPMLRNGYVTFGSFNRAPKAGVETIPLWAALLHAAPRSRLMLKSRGLGDEGSRRRILEGFAAHGIGADRIDLVEANLELSDHLAAYGQIDIALDTFPYHGTTTTCEAMWMGAPVVTLVGQTHVSRVGLSLLTAVGLTELAASSHEMYVRLATELANDPLRLRTIRQDLRQRLINSPLCDAKRLTRAIEQAYRQSFANWCRAGA